MKKYLYTAALGCFLYLAGCGFLDYATHEQPVPPGSPPGTVPTVPIVAAGKEAIDSGVSAWLTGGAVAGVLAFLGTYGKSFARIYAQYLALKPTAVKV